MSFRLRSPVSLILCPCLFISPACPAAEQNTWVNSYVVDAPDSGVELGMGWNRYSESIVPNRCIQFAPIQEGGQMASLTLTEVSDSSELGKHLGVSVSASIKGLAYSASGSASFVEDSTVKASSTSFAVHASVTNGALFVGPYQPTAPRRFSLGSTQLAGAGIPVDSTEAATTVGLSPWVLEKFPPGSFDEEAFRRYCGTGFVSAVYSGAEMFHVTTITTSDETTRQAVKATVRGSYGVGAVSASGEQDHSAAFVQANTEMSFFQWGGASGNIPSSREEVVAKLQSLPREAADAPKFYDIQITPYSDLPNYPGQSPPKHQFHKDIIVRRFLQLKSFDRDLQAVIDSLRAPGSATAAVQNTDPPQPKPDPVLFDTCFAVDYYENMQDAVRILLAFIEKAQQETADADWDYKNFKAPENAIRQLGLAVAYDEVIPVPIFHDGLQDNWFLNWLAHGLSIARLKSLLPPLMSPGSQLCKPPADTTKRALFRERVLDQYIRPGNNRLCRDSYDDIDCLSNKEIAELSQYIPFIASMQKIDPGARNQSGYLCSAHPTPLRRCVARAASGADVRMTTDLSRAALFNLEADGSAVVFVQAPADTDDAPSPVALSLGAAGPVLSKRQSYKIIAASKGDSRNIQFVPGARAGDANTFVYRLAPKNPDQQGQLCLLDENADGSAQIDARLLVWPRDMCNANEKAGFTRDAYSWIFFSEDLYTPPDDD